MAQGSRQVVVVKEKSIKSCSIAMKFTQNDIKHILDSLKKVVNLETKPDKNASLSSNPDSWNQKNLFCLTFALYKI